MTVVMLEGFLIVCPRKQSNSDQDALKRERHEGESFDKVLRELRLPKAVSKDQPSTFTTNWCEVQYHSPMKRWERFAKFFEESVLTCEAETVKTMTADLV